MRLTLLIAALLACLTGVAQAEQLKYELLWTGVKAGTAVLSIAADAKGQVVIRSTARSEDWVSAFYLVDDLAQSTLAGGLPVHYGMRINEGAVHKDRESVFDRQSGKVTYVDHKKNWRKTYQFIGPVYDPLSGFNHVRFGELVPSESFYVSIFDSHKFTEAEVQVMGRERVTVPAGTFDTILIKPKLKSDGIFSTRGDILIWLTDDRRRLPVKLVTKVLIGSIEANLTSFSGSASP